jgi:mono/diheme cytochrome c family protein
LACSKFIFERNHDAIAFLCEAGSGFGRPQGLSFAERKPGALFRLVKTMKRRIGFCLGAGLASFVAAWGCISVPASRAQQTPAPAAGDKAAQIERGSQAFIGNGCGFCHENGGRKTGRGPQLMDDAHDDDFLMSRIATGSPGRMPAFGQALPVEHIQAIIAYIRNLQP